MTSPYKLDRTLSPYYKNIIDEMKSVPERLAQAKVIGGDFMTDGNKCQMIIELNRKKGNFI